MKTKTYTISLDVEVQAPTAKACDLVAQNRATNEADFPPVQGTAEILGDYQIERVGPVRVTQKREKRILAAAVEDARQEKLPIG